MNTLCSLAQKVGLKLKQKGQKLVTAESCTGGLVAEVITNIPGSSKWFERGFVTYSLESKIELLDVPRKMLFEDGAVSESVAKKMATGALAKSNADWAIAVTGIVGPGGGTAKTPVGFVWIAWANSHTVLAETFQFSGDRLRIRKKAAKAALFGLASKL